MKKRAGKAYIMAEVVIIKITIHRRVIIKENLFVDLKV